MRPLRPLCLALLGGGVEDVDELAVGCRFSDCGHDSEPGCAVRAAIEDGALDATRLESWRKIARNGRRSALKEARRPHGLLRKGRPRRRADWE